MQSNLTSRIAMMAGLATVAASASALGLGVQDFESLTVGQWVTTELSGITITTVNLGGGPDKAIVFDSANTTGEDPDLATPGYHPTNTQPLGKILIIAEDDVDGNNDGFVDDPDDEAGGGVIKIEFDSIADSGYAKILDIEEAGGEIDFYLNDVWQSSVAIAAIGDNSYQKIDWDGFDFDRMDVSFVGSGGLGEFAAVPEPATLGALGIAAAALLRRRKK